WDVTRGQNEIIAVLDTGVDMNHPDLQGHLLPGIDYVPAVTDFDPSPDPAAPNHTHGTHVTGIANALTNNGVGIAGVAWDASTLPVRIIGPTGAAIDDEMLGIVYAVGHGATVINMSLGGAGWFQNERNAMNYAANYGVIVVASAGNDNSGVPFYPASYDHVISVANITSSETRSPSSNFGPYIDISAPGTNIHSTLYDNTYGDMSGTSMAAPHIAGVIALIQSAGRADTPAEVMEALLCTGKNLGTAGWDQYYGWGLVQANQAVLYTPGTNACLSTVANDSIDNAQPLTFHFSHTIDTTHATSWAGDPMPCAGDKNNTVWYRFDATRQGTLFLDTAGSSYDTVLAAYRKPASSLELAGCNNDADGGTTTSYLPIAVNVGDVLYVMVASNEKIVYDPLYPTRATPVGGTLKFKAELDYIPLAGCFGSEYSTSSIICISE
ncbi:MAG: S8 family serine peptidase, partial [Chloroflexi bacterium]|nr:S8 family serine peptidase [Chloroflexota bacterium]